MFGYVKPAYGELRVREHELYKAYYCGLCRAMGRTTGQLSRFSLNYDLVFLAMMRQVFEGARTKLSLRRCPVHPVKKRPSVGMNGALSYASYASAILTAGKIRDDIADERAVRRAAARLELAACRTLRRRSEKSLPDLADFVCAHLARLREYELAGEKSVDTVSAVFGDLLSDVSCTSRMPPTMHSAILRTGATIRLRHLSAVISASAARYTTFADTAECAVCLSVRLPRTCSARLHISSAI